MHSTWCITCWSRGKTPDGKPCRACHGDGYVRVPAPSARWREIADTAQRAVRALRVAR